MNAPPKQSFYIKNTLRVLSVLIYIGESLIRITSSTGKQAFIDQQNFKWTQLPEKNWEFIREELDIILAERDKIPAFHKVSPEQKTLGVDNAWKAYVFYVFGRPIHKNCNACPKTASILKQIPGLQNAMFSILAPHRSIPIHRGPYKGLLRHHLGLKIPDNEDKLSITVNNITKGWAEGKTLILDDSYPHFVTNDSDGERVILFTDFIRPLPWPVSLYNRLVVLFFSQTPLAKEPIALINKRVTKN